MLLVFNDSMTSRTPLTAALSTDGDKTYPHPPQHRQKVATALPIPIGFQAADGRVHIVYTSDQRTVINHAVFSEDWVKAQP